MADKEYRKRGGKFAFPSPLDTFVRGLHRRTTDLHNDWKVRLHKETSGDDARRQAVAEMLLRLRWDDSNDAARAKLSLLVERIWDGSRSSGPLPHACWCCCSGVHVGERRLDWEETALLCALARRRRQLSRDGCEHGGRRAAPGGSGRADDNRRQAFRTSACELKLRAGAEGSPRPCRRDERCERPGGYRNSAGVVSSDGTR